MSDLPFGLRRRPFPTTPDLSCYYAAGTHEHALAALLAGLADGEGFLLVTGDPGTGKTLLCHALLDRLARDASIAFLTHTNLRDPASLLQALLYDLSLPHGTRSEQEMRLALIDHVLGRYREGKRTVLVIDEAQNLTGASLEELRLLGNLEGQAGKAVQVVLAALPEITATLAQPALASLRQRISVRVQLDPLPVEEAADYLLHHLRAAGGRVDRIIGDEALELLARQTGGVPRLLNQTAQLALRLAAENEAEIDVEVALAALADFGLAVEDEAPEAV
ncbi:MAG: AAA family ATPase [Gemmataceae bacterium]